MMMSYFSEFVKMNVRSSVRLFDSMTVTSGGHHFFHDPMVDGLQEQSGVAERRQRLIDTRKVNM